MKRKYDILFCSTSNFGNKIYQYLDEHHNIVGVITTTPKPKGRGLKITDLPFVQKAKLKNIKCHYVDKKKDFTKVINDNYKKGKDFDFAVVVDFGMIIPENVFDYARHDFINIHPSLLPLHRGASPIQTTLINNDSITGVTIQSMTKKVDAGDIYLILKTRIFENENFSLLYEKLERLSIESLDKFFHDFDYIDPVPQNHDLATYTEKIEKYHSKIDFNNEASRICGKIKAFSKWPKVKFKLNNDILMFINAIYINENFSTKIGEIVNIDKIKIRHDDSDNYIEETGIWINCKHGTCIVTEIQKPGKNVVTIDDFLRGYRKIEKGMVFTTLN